MVQAVAVGELARLAEVLEAMMVQLAKTGVWEVKWGELVAWVGPVVSVVACTCRRLMCLGGCLRPMAALRRQ